MELLKRLRCRFHPANEQQRAIADFLDRETERIDALVAKKQRLIELLQEKRTALISHAVTKGLDPDVPMKDSGIEWLGQMPCALGVPAPSSAAGDQLDVGPQCNPTQLRLTRARRSCRQRRCAESHVDSARTRVMSPPRAVTGASAARSAC